MADRDDVDNVYLFRPKIDRPTIDLNNQLAARRAIQSILSSQRVAISSRRFQGGQSTIRVLVDGEYYDVDARRLEQLQAGATPFPDVHRKITPHVKSACGTAENEVPQM